MKTLMRVRWRPPSAHAPKFWIWTYKIMPDLWLVDLFCLIKKKFHTPPYSPPVLCIGSCTHHQCGVLEAFLTISAVYWKLYSPLGWSLEFFLIGQNRSSNQRSGRHDFRSPNPTHAHGALAHKHQSFHFQKIQGGLNINIFLWKLVRSFLLQ